MAMAKSTWLGQDVLDAGALHSEMAKNDGRCRQRDGGDERAAAGKLQSPWKCCGALNWPLLLLWGLIGASTSNRAEVCALVHVVPVDEPDFYGEGGRKKKSLYVTGVSTGSKLSAPRRMHRLSAGLGTVLKSGAVERGRVLLPGQQEEDDISTSEASEQQDKGKWCCVPCTLCAGGRGRALLQDKDMSAHPHRQIMAQGPHLGPKLLLGRTLPGRTAGGGVFWRRAAAHPPAFTGLAGPPELPCQNAQRQDLSCTAVSRLLAADGRCWER